VPDFKTTPADSSDLPTLVPSLSIQDPAFHFASPGQSKPDNVSHMFQVRLEGRVACGNALLLKPVDNSGSNHLIRKGMCLQCWLGNKCFTLFALFDKQSSNLRNLLLAMIRPSFFTSLLHLSPLLEMPPKKRSSTGKSDAQAIELQLLREQHEEQHEEELLFLQEEHDARLLRQRQHFQDQINDYGRRWTEAATQQQATTKLKEQRYRTIVAVLGILGSLLSLAAWTCVGCDTSADDFRSLSVTMQEDQTCVTQICPGDLSFLHYRGPRDRESCYRVLNTTYDAALYYVLAQSFDEDGFPLEQKDLEEQRREWAALAEPAKNRLQAKWRADEAWKIGATEEEGALVMQIIESCWGVMEKRKQDEVTEVEWRGWMARKLARDIEIVDSEMMTPDVSQTRFYR